MRLAFAQDDIALLNELLDAHGSEIEGIARLILRDRTEAEDVLQETMLAAMRNVGHLRDVSSRRAWLLKVATNKSLSVRRRIRLEGQRLGRTREVYSPDHGPRVIARIAFLRALGRLPIRVRTAVVLRYFADMSVEEVAETMRVSPNTVKRQLHIGLARLREDRGWQVNRDGR